MILGIFLPFFLSFNRTLVSNIPVDRFFNFFHVSNIFRIPSPSLYSTYLSRILLATVIYLCVSRSIRSAGSDVRKIFYSIENGILIHARPTLLPPIVSILRVGRRKLRISTRRPSRYSTLLREQVGRRKRAAAYGWIDGSEEGCTRINTETWSLELIPEPSKVHLETPAASLPPHPSFF